MKLYTLLLLLLPFWANAQFLDDKINREITIKGLDQIYNLQFDAAEESLKSVKKTYANHPVSSLLNAIQMQWEFLPLEKNPTVLKRYIAELQKCQTSARNLYKDKRYKKEAVFFLLASHG